LIPEVWNIHWCDVSGIAADTEKQWDVAVQTTETVIFSVQHVTAIRRLRYMNFNTVYGRSELCRQIRASLTDIKYWSRRNAVEHFILRRKHRYLLLENGFKANLSKTSIGGARLR
jgi:hypothetical protein